jgi:hypothetical protein
MYTSLLMSARTLKNGLALVLGTALASGCETAPGRGDAAAVPTSQRVAEVSVRIDAPPGGVPAVSVLAFRASVKGLAPGADVLGVIDPLVAAAPDRCELRDVTVGSRSLRAQGATIDLEELPSVSLALGADGAATMRPIPRVYPQLGAAVGGVVGEAGPVDLPAVPESIGVGLQGETEPRIQVTLPGVPRLLDQNGQALVAGSRLDPTRDLQLILTGPAPSFLEIRPFGASRFIACPAGPGGRVVVTRDLLEKLTASSGRVAISFEAVWRDSRILAGAHATRLSIEARSSAVLDLSAADAAETARPTTPIAP